MANQKKARQGAEKRTSSMARLSHPVTDDLDRTPVEMPAGFQRPTPLTDIIARMVREQIQIEKDDEFETPEEADDFEEEDPELLDMSAYTFDTVDRLAESSEILEPQETVAESPQEPSEAPQTTMTGDPPDQNAVEPEKP